VRRRRTAAESIAMTKRHLFFRWLSVASSLVIVGTLFWAIVRDTRYYNRWPTIAQSEIGRTIPREVRRSVTVYISPQDAQFDHTLEGFRIYSALLLVIFICLSGELTRSLEQNREQQ
jgi:hypothetical protein